jgi:beta-glucosidase
LRAASVAQAPAPDSPAIEAQAHAMLSKLTLEQKIELLGGVDSMYTRPMPAIGLPRFKMSDASVGVRTWGPTTAYAGGVGPGRHLGPELARKIGEAFGRDARARSVNFLLGPGVNIARSPIAGRNFEYLSEDPFLNSASWCRSLRACSRRASSPPSSTTPSTPGVQPPQRSSDVDERTMREIYLPAFEAAVTKATSTR